MATITGITTARTFVFEQRRVARYVALAETAGGFTIPDPASGISDRHIQPIEFPA
jgi:hypothetical protein